MRKLFFALMLVLVACSTEPCEKDSFGYLVIDNQDDDFFSIQVTVTDSNQDTIEVIVINEVASISKTTVEVPIGLVNLNSNPPYGKGLDIGLVNICDSLVFEIEYVGDTIIDCGSCQIVTEDADGNITRSTPVNFCGDAYEEKVNSNPITVEGVTSWWDCY